METTNPTNRKQWDELPTSLRVMFRHLLPERAPTQGANADIYSVFGEKRAIEIHDKGLTGFLHRQPSWMQRAAFDMVSIAQTGDTSELEVAAKQVCVHVEEGNVYEAQKHLGNLAMLVSNEVDFTESVVTQPTEA